MASQTLEILIQAKLQTDNAFKEARSGLNKIGDAAERNRGKLLAVAGGVAAIGVASIKFASDLDEARNKSNVTFGAFGDQVEEFASTAAQNFALSERAALEYSGTLGTILNASGLAAKASADMSVEMVKLASDLASFNNIPIEEALNKLRSGLVGEAEPLRTVGVLISQAALETKALEMGIGDLNGVLTEGEKVAVRYALIMEQTTSQQGDFARTSESVANQLKIAQAQMEDAAATLGTQLLPIATKVIKAFSELVGWFASLDETAQKNILIMGGVVLGLAAIGLALPPVIAGFGLLSAAVGVLNAAFLLLLANPIVAAMAAIVVGLVAVTAWYTNLATDAELAAEGVEKVTNELDTFKEKLIGTGEVFERTGEAVVAMTQEMIDAAKDLEAAESKALRVVEQTVNAKILQRELEREAIQSVVDAEEQAAADSLSIALKQAEEIVAASDKRYADLADLREQNLAHDLGTMKTRGEAAQALIDDNRAAFEAIKATVDSLPSVIGADGSAVAGAGDSDRANVFRLFKASQNAVTDSLALAVKALAAGPTDSATSSQLQAEVDRLRGITGSSQFRGDELGQLFAPPGGFGSGGPPMLPGMMPFPVTINVEGSITAEDVAGTITQGLAEIAARGGGN